MVQNTPTHQPNVRAAYVPGCFLTVLLIVLAVAFWSRIVTLAWYWQVGLAICALVLLARAFATGRSRELWQVAMPDALINAGRYEEALKALDALIPHCSTNSEAHYLRGQCLDHFGRTVEADAAWQEALKHNPRHMKAANNLACDYMARKDFLVAAKYFTIAIESGLLMTTDLECRKNVDLIKHALTETGLAAERAGDFQQALQYADVRVKIDPEFAIAYAWRAKQHLALRNWKSAIEDSKTCLRLDPKYEKVKAVLHTAEEELNRELAGKQLAPREPTSSGRGPTSTSAATLLKSGSGAPKVVRPTQADRAGGTESATLLWQIGQKAFNRFEIRRIFHGGMGTIYCAWDKQSDMPVALKAIKPTQAVVSARGQGTFRREAEHWFRLGKHPRIVELLSVEKLDFRHLVVVMEYITGEPGPTLHDHLREKRRLLAKEAARIAIGICEAMQFAHDSRKLVHRDLKPQNVFITALGQVKVGDFGLAEVEGTPMGEFAGTPQYAAPEQWDPGARIAPAMDVYAIGIILFEMVCGSLPFGLPEEYRNAHEAVQLAQFGKMHCEQPLPTPDSLCPDLDPRLVAVILQCLAKDGSRRPATAVALRRALLPLVGMRDHPVTEDAVGSLEDSVAARAYNAGVTADSLGYYSEALTHYQEAVRHEPLKSQKSDAWCNIGKVLGQMYRHEEALTAYQQAVRINPDDLHAMHGVAVCLDALRLHEKALEVIEQALRKAPERTDSHVCKGSILLGLKRVDLAVEVYARALELKPDHQYALNGLGLCSEAQGHYQEALELFGRAVEIHEEFAQAHHNRSRMLTLLGREEEAVEAALRAVQYEPNNAIYLLTLGEVYGNVRRFQEALGPLEQAVRLDPNNGRIYLSLAEIYGETGQFAKAAECGLRAAKLGEPRGTEVAKMARDATRVGSVHSAVEPPKTVPLPIGTAGRSTCQPPALPAKPVIRRSIDQAVMHEVIKNSGVDLRRILLMPEGPAKKAALAKHTQRIRELCQAKISARKAAVPTRTPVSPGPRKSLDQITCTCGAENPLGNQFCNRCGKPLGRSTMIQCPHCSQTVPEGVAFCVHCGTELGHQGGPENRGL